MSRNAKKAPKRTLKEKRNDKKAKRKSVMDVFDKK